MQVGSFLPDLASDKSGRACLPLDRRGRIYRSLHQDPPTLPCGLRLQATGPGERPLDLPLVGPGLLLTRVINHLQTLRQLPDFGHPVPDQRGVVRGGVHAGGDLAGEGGLNGAADDFL